MSDSINLACHECGEREVPVDQVSALRVNGRTTCGWICPTCKTHQIRIADVPMLTRLSKAGLSARAVEMKPSARPAGEPLTEDDFLDFGRRIEGAS